MGTLDKLLRKVSARIAEPSSASAAAATAPVDAEEEGRLRGVLREDPNDVPAFVRLADIVRRNAGETHAEGDPQRAADDAVWALAEELSHSGRAWFPLIEIARLSVHDDRDVALRRLSTAAERDPTGQALATGVQMLREAGLPDEALGLGVGHWRPREHVVEAGRQVVEAAVDAGRSADARRHLEILLDHPDVARMPRQRRDLEHRVTELEQLRSGGIPVVDLRDAEEATTATGLRRVFRRR
jgi:hypothetical protein